MDRASRGILLGNIMIPWIEESREARRSAGFEIINKFKLTEKISLL
jgi:hypothetical protein